MIDFLIGMLAGAIGFFGGVIFYLWLYEPGIYTKKEVPGVHKD